MKIKLKPLKVLRQTTWPTVPANLLKKITGKVLVVEECNLNSGMLCVEHPKLYTAFGKIQDWHLWIDPDMVADVLECEPKWFGECQVCQLTRPVMTDEELVTTRCPRCQNTTFCRPNLQKVQTMNDFIKEHLAKQEQQNERWAKLKAIAQEQRLVMVQMSARRFVVIMRAGTGNCRSITPGKYFTYEDGSIVFGPSTYQKYQQYIEDKVQPIPQELTEQ